MIIKAPTLTILLPIYDRNGVLRFPNSGGPYFGIHCPIDHRLSLAKQATHCVEEFFGLRDLSGKIEPVAAIDPVLRDKDADSSILYLMVSGAKIFEANPSWITIAQILRDLSKGSNRLAYMKALQYMAGAADAELSVLEVDEEVRNRLKDLASEKSTVLVD